MKSLEELRARLDVLDRQILELIAERQSLGGEIAAVKRTTGQSTRDFRREREVLLKARRDAEALGVSPALAESILQTLIRGSLTTQEQARVAAQGRGSGRTALVIGGRGKMGRWTADFLASQGFRITIADPAGDVPGYEWVADWAATPLDHDLIVVATPLKTANEVLLALAERRPTRGRLRRRVAQDTAARRPLGAAGGRRARDLGASDVRPGHRAAVRPPRHLHRSRRRRRPSTRRARCSRRRWPTSW